MVIQKKTVKIDKNHKIILKKAATNKNVLI